VASNFLGGRKDIRTLIAQRNHAERNRWIPLGSAHQAGVHKGPPVVRCVISPSLSCNGLQWKWVRTAINENLGPDYLHLSIPSGRDYVPLRLLLSIWDCNRRRWDHITCDSPEAPSSACLYAKGSICISRERLGGAPVSYIFRPGTRVSHNPSKHPIETQKLSPLLCFMRVDLTKTGGREEPAGGARARHVVRCRESCPAVMDCSPGWMIAVSVAHNPVLSAAIEAINVVRKMR
jgi:hypothetical protein